MHLYRSAKKFRMQSIITRIIIWNYVDNIEMNTLGLKRKHVLHSNINDYKKNEYFFS